MENKNNIEFYDVVRSINHTDGYYYAVKDVVLLKHTDNIWGVRPFPKLLSRGVIKLINDKDSFVLELSKAYEDFKKDDLGECIRHYQTSCGEVQIKRFDGVTYAYLSSEK